MPNLVIPEGQKATWEAFVSLAEDEANALLSALDTVQPEMRVEWLRKSLSAALGTRFSSELDLVGMLVGMARSRSDLAMPAEEFAAKIVAVAQVSINVAPKRAWPDVESTLAQCLANRAIKITAKALRVYADHPRPVSSIRIVSDFRPLIDQDTSEVGALTIVHQLKVSYHDHEGSGAGQDFYATMDYNDLVKLKATVDRALAKHIGMTKLPSQASVPLIEDRPNDATGVKDTA